MLILSQDLSPWLENSAAKNIDSLMSMLTTLADTVTERACHVTSLKVLIHGASNPLSVNTGVADMRSTGRRQLIAASFNVLPKRSSVGQRFSFFVLNGNNMVYALAHQTRIF